MRHAYEVIEIILTTKFAEKKEVRTQGEEQQNTKNTIHLTKHILVQKNTKYAKMLQKDKQIMRHEIKLICSIYVVLISSSEQWNHAFKNIDNIFDYGEKTETINKKLETIP